MPAQQRPRSRTPPPTDRTKSPLPPTPTRQARRLWLTSSLTQSFKTPSRWEQTILVVKMSIRLTWMTVRGSPLWVVNFIRLILYALFCAPALARSIRYYFSGAVDRSLRYGPKVRHTADVYRPIAIRGEKAPTVIFVSGGAWVIGYKAWASLTGRALAAHGVLVFAPDYRNCPQCDVHGMASDVDLSIGWCLEKCEEYGGDRDNVVLVGQSAGAHLCALVLLRGAVHWRPTDLRGFVGISGPYHVPATAAHWRARGFGQAMLDFIFGDEAGMLLASPSYLAARAEEVELPPMLLLHGTADKSATAQSTLDFAAALEDLGVDVHTKLYEGWTHTDPILERPFAGDQRLHRDLLEAVSKWCDGPVAPFADDTPGLGRLCPQVLIELGRRCMPF